LWDDTHKDIGDLSGRTAGELHWIINYKNNRHKKHLSVLGKGSFCGMVDWQIERKSKEKRRWV
jgi:hypothetical protein